MLNQHMCTYLGYFPLILRVTKICNHTNSQNRGRNKHDLCGDSADLIFLLLLFFYLKATYQIISWIYILLECNSESLFASLIQRFHYPVDCILFQGGGGIFCRDVIWCHDCHVKSIWLSMEFYCLG